MDQKKVTRGRQKVAMKKMTKISNLQVTFSKRRSGLFKKASELCTLCGPEMALIIFSPGNKVFSFGHPCVKSVIDRYLTKNPIPVGQTPGTMQLIEAYRNASIRELTQHLTQIQNQLAIEKKLGEELSQMSKASKAQNWWEGPIEEMEPVQLEQMKVALEELQKTVARKAEKLLIESANPTFNVMPPSFHGSSSTSHGIPFEINNDVVGSTSTNPVMHMPPNGYNHGYGGHEFF
ncbi:hypothetical protein UlMin_037206 [Ulmus minor]